MVLSKKGLLFCIYTALCVAILSLALPASLLAQLPSGIAPEKLLLSSAPTAPAPYQNVTIIAESYLTDLNRAVITWTVNGKQVDRGVGKTQIKVTMGAVGSELVIRAVANTPDQGNITSSLTLTAAAVTLIIEGETYTPPLYEGRALYSPNATAKITAIPQLLRGGSLVPPGDLVYTWKKDGKNVPTASGYGKSSYTVSPGFLTRPLRIEVEVSNVNQTVLARSAVELTTTPPLVVMYEKDPALGLIRERALETSYQLKNKEITVAAIPYFFSTPSPRGSSISYVWKMNGQAIANQSIDPSLLTLRQNGEVTGQGFVGVEVNHASQILQAARASFSVFFGNTVTPLTP